jgi:hypothetical protein
MAVECSCPGEVSVTPAFFWSRLTLVYINHVFIKVSMPLADLISTSIPIGLDQWRNNSDESLEFGKLSL